MDRSLICNIRKCRKQLKNDAWVTSCSHVFCDEDGSKEFRKSYTCPACDTSLSGKYDIIKIDLQPSDQYKSMVLVGQQPETIMEICSRALTFWSYQTQQEKTYQEYVNTKSKERNLQLEQYYEQLISRTQTELSTTKKELDNLKKQFNEAQDKAVEKSRQHQKLQSLYDALRIKMLNPSRYNGPGGGGGGDAGPPTPSQLLNRSYFSGIHTFTTGEDMLRSSGGSSGDGGGGGRNKVYGSPEQTDRDFVLRPNHTPVFGVGGSGVPPPDQNLTGPAILSRFGTPRDGGGRAQNGHQHHKRP